MDQTVAQMKAEAAFGSALATTPLWVLILNDISLVAGAIAAVCGAIVGLYAVWRIWKRSRRAMP